jgi:tetratricopeptide (TPR) repeat protein
MKKYKLKNAQNELLGNFLVSEIAELFSKGSLSGTEQIYLEKFQRWGNLYEDEDVRKIINDVLDGKIGLTEIREKTERIIGNLRQKRKEFENHKKNEELKVILDKMELTKSKQYKEFNYEVTEGENPNRDNKDTDSNENSGNVATIPTKKTTIEKPVTEIKKTKIKEKKKEFEFKEIEPILEKTRVNIKLKDLENNNIEKGDDEPDWLISLKSGNKNPNEKQHVVVNENEKTQIQNQNLPAKIDYDAKTEVVNLYEVIPRVKGDVTTFEQEISNREKKTKVVKNIDLKKGSRPIIILVIIGLIFYLLMDSNDTPRAPIFSNISFPKIYEVANPGLAKEEYNKGLNSYEKNDFLSKIRAASHFKKSIEYEFQNNPALGFLILVYGELFAFSKDKKDDSLQLYKLLKVARPKISSDINVAMGAALFYRDLKKYEASLNFLENYLRVSPEKKTLKFIAIYLDALLLTGKYDKAAGAFEILLKSTPRPIEAYLAMANFNESEQYFDKAKEVIEEGYQSFENSVPLLIKYAELTAKLKDFKKLEEINSLISKLFAEDNAIYFAKYLEFEGIVAAAKGDFKGATSFLKKSLEIVENSDLRFKLSSLDTSGLQDVDALILESKVKVLLDESAKYLKNNEFQLAKIAAIKAVDLNDTYLPSVLFLSDINRKMGYLKDSLSTLEQANFRNPRDVKVMFALVDTYIDAYRLDEAQKMMLRLRSGLSNIPSEFKRLEGKYALKKNYYNKAVASFQSAINQDGLNDALIYELAEIFFANRNYMNAKEQIVEAINIDPTNLNYHILYSKILYEMDTLDVALGYLRDIEKDFPKDPRILSNIAILYYRAGKIKLYDQLKKELTGQYKFDKDFYKFLIETAILNDRSQEVIDYSLELIKVDPADLESRITLAIFLFENSRFQDALDVLKQVEERLPTYPKLYYYMSKIYLKQGDEKKAVEAAENEIKTNPTLEWGYILLGEIQIQQKDYSKARKNLEEALKRNLNSIDALLGMGWIKYSQNLINEALELYIRANKQDPGNATAHKQLGHIYVKKGQGSLAYQSFTVYLELAPEADDAELIRNMMSTLK